MTKSTFKTDNLTLSTSLHSVGHPVAVEMFSSTKAIFCFPVSDQLNEDISKFWSNELAVSPLVFQEKKKALWQMIDQAKGKL